MKKFIHNCLVFFRIKTEKEILISEEKKYLRTLPYSLKLHFSMYYGEYRIKCIETPHQTKYYPEVRRFGYSNYNKVIETKHPDYFTRKELAEEHINKLKDSHKKRVDEYNNTNIKYIKI